VRIFGRPTTPHSEGMTSTELRPTPRLVDSLADVAIRHPLARKLIVAPNFASGRELLRRLSLVGGGWIGFEVVTPVGLAYRLARTGLERAGLSVVDTFDQQVLLDRSLDSALIAERGDLAELSEGVGFREAVHGAMRELRAAGIGTRDLDRARFSQWEKKLFLLRVLQRYERLLLQHQKADSASVLKLAIAALEEEGRRLPPTLDADVVLLLPGLGTRGLVGELVSALGARGGRVLETDPVLGLDAPDSVLWNRSAVPAPGSHLYAPGSDDEAHPPARVDFFRASSVETELREVLRRILASGLSWDEVEIISSDPAAYGSALHALSTRLGIPVTYAVGVPIGRTRTGRVVRAYLDWIEEGFQASPVRRLLEAGDLRPPRAKGTHAPAALARRFRTLRIGWGRKRYRTQLREAISATERLEARPHESEEAFAKRRDRARAELDALRSILFPALKATPAVPDRMGEGPELVSPGELARGLRAFLRRVPRGKGPDRSARDEVGRVLERVAATVTRRTEFRAAVAILRQYLDLRVRAEFPGNEFDGAVAPWSSAGGALHLSDFEHGAFSGRPATFLVGMDSERVPGGGGQDPVLLDSDRRVLGTVLPTSAELLREQVFRVAALVARIRGEVTMSYGAWQAAEARTVGPSSVLLQALRLSRGDEALTFQDLHDAMGRVVSVIPDQGSPMIDADDVWMTVLGSGGAMRRGVGAVRASYGCLDDGLVAMQERRVGLPGAVHGVIAPRPDELDPRRNEAAVVSASRLEALGTCPLRYLQSSILRVYPPDDPELDPDAWLDNRMRGSLLHEVYDVALRTAHRNGMKVDESAFEMFALDALRAGVGRLREQVPIPGEGVFARERIGLEEDVLAFVRMVRLQGPECVALELKFGLGEDEPVVLELADGAVRLRGAIDRVDADLAGFHVVDYKTGVAHGYGGTVFNGGRRLQHALYAHAAEQRLGGDVVDGQYHYPTRRGQNQSFAFERARLGTVTGLLSHMLDGVAAGRFIPTDEPKDCTFCDFAEVCRVKKGGLGKTSSPLADWSKGYVNTGASPAFEQLRNTRSYED
jgi:ATP-dependent helicase/nuclease subunit B